MYVQDIQLPLKRTSVRPFSFTKIMVFLAFVLGVHVLFVYKSTLILTSHDFWFIKAYVVLTGLFLISRFLLVIFYTDNHDVAYSASSYPSVSFVIAGKNEEASIFKTIEACMESRYAGPMECIAIDDGSTDNTRREMYRARAWYRRQRKRVKVIGFNKNRGKREGMAEGALAATSEIIVFVDSDSFLERDAVRHITEHFLADPEVAAVSGNSGVENKEYNMLTKMQSARYGISFDIFKACESVFGVVTCCPGCFSAYRKDALLAVLTPWRNQMFLGTRSTFGDDRSLTNYILRNWKVVYCQSAIAMTIVPEKIRVFFKQQLRWKKSWIREGLMAAGFIWRKNIVASVSFYTNLLLPIFSPIVVFNALIIQPALFQRVPSTFLLGLTAMSLLYGLFYFWQSSNRYWVYILPFTLMYTFALVWQMPYALFKLRDTSWGTR